MAKQEEDSREHVTNPEKDSVLIPAVIIEDESELVYILDLWLERAGFTTVGKAKNREEADQLVDQLKDLGNPVVFLDGNLSNKPDENGETFTYKDGKEIGQKIIDADPDVNIIIVGISSNNEPLKHIINFGIEKTLLRGTKRPAEFSKIREAWIKIQS